MPVPKKKRSKARRGNRRGQQGLKKPNYIPCPQCGEPSFPHRVCMSCGYYKGKMALEIKAD
jgi:large subunit ribosomal protein L32